MVVFAGANRVGQMATSALLPPLVAKVMLPCPPAPAVATKASTRIALLATLETKTVPLLAVALDVKNVGVHSVVLFIMRSEQNATAAVSLDEARSPCRTHTAPWLS